MFDCLSGKFFCKTENSGAITSITSNITATNTSDNATTTTNNATTTADNATIITNNSTIATTTTTTQLQLTSNAYDKKQLILNEDVCEDMSQPLKNLNDSVEEKDENEIQYLEDNIILKDNKIKKLQLFSNNDDLILSKKINEIDIIDPATWSAVKITQQMKYEIIYHGPSREKNINYPLHLIDNSERKFSNEYYSKKLSNGEIVKWLIYSVSIDKVFCFCGKLFSHSNSNISSLASKGTNDWKHLSEKLNLHETSRSHIDNAHAWSELKMRINKQSTIDLNHQMMIEKEKQHWKDVMKRIITVIHYLAKHHDAFRGSSDTLYTNNNGKFFGLIEMLGKFDPIIMKHINRIQNKETHVHYLGPRIQNNLIESMAGEVKKKNYNEDKIRQVLRYNYGLYT